MFIDQETKLKIMSLNYLVQIEDEHSMSSDLVSLLSDQALLPEHHLFLLTDEEIKDIDLMVTDYFKVKNDIEDISDMKHIPLHKSEQNEMDF